MTTPIHTESRLDYLDAVRAFALILGIVFHAGLSFIPIYIGWAVMDVSTSEWVSIFTLISHSFRMELFFLIAGFFSHYTMKTQGTRHFIQSRLVRIGIPFLIGWIVLRPMLVSGWIMGMQSLQGDVKFLLAMEQSIQNVISYGESWLVGTHLWFLYYLLIISLSVLLVRNVIHWYKPVANWFSTHANPVFLALLNKGLLPLVLIIISTLCVWFMQRWGVDTPDKSLTPEWPVFTLYATCFVLGWLLHKVPGSIETFTNIKWPLVIVGVCAIAATIGLAKYEAQLAHPQYAWFKAAFSLSYASMMWFLVVMSIGLCRRMITRSNAFIRYLADASYWLYLVHLPIVVWLQVTVAEWPWHWSAKLLFVCVVTIGLSLLVYDLCVRATFIGKCLNGKVKPRALFRPPEKMGVSVEG